MRKLYYGWYIVGVSFICFALAIGARFSFSIFYVAILKDFGWSRGMTAGAFSLGMAVYAIFAPISGSLLHRLGPRVVFSLGALILGLGLALSSRINMVWHLYVYQGLLVAIGISALGFTTNITYIARWFRRRIGTANGIAGAGIGFGLLVLGPSIQHVIEQDGWRRAYLLFGALVPVVMVPLSLLVHRPGPQSMGLRVDGQPPAAIDSQPAPDSKEQQKASLPVGSIVRSPKFLLMLPVAFGIGFGNNAIIIHSVAHMVDVGYSAMLAAASLGLLNAVRTIGSLLGGYASDRIGRSNAYVLGSASSAIGIILFLNLDLGRSFLYGFLLFYGMGLGALSPIYGALVADIVPQRNLGFILGLFEIIYGLSAAFGTWFAGALFDRLQSYTVPFTLVVISIGVAIACVLGIGRIDRADRQGQATRRA